MNIEFGMRNEELGMRNAAHPPPDRIAGGRGKFPIPNFYFLIRGVGGWM
jgi:hypothetical protein